MSSQFEKKEVCNPSTKSYDCVRDRCKDPLMLAKLHFFNSVAKELTPFLTRFQIDTPVVPFLAGELQAVLKKLMPRIMKKKVIASANTVQKLMKLDPTDKKSRRNYNKIDVAYNAGRSLKELVQKKRYSNFRKWILESSARKLFHQQFRRFH